MILKLILKNKPATIAKKAKKKRRLGENEHSQMLNVFYSLSS